MAILSQPGELFPDAVHDHADARVVVPMKPEVRSLNVAVAAAAAEVDRLGAIARDGLVHQEQLLAAALAEFDKQACSTKGR